MRTCAYTVSWPRCNWSLTSCSSQCCVISPLKWKQMRQAVSAGRRGPQWVAQWTWTHMERCGSKEKHTLAGYTLWVQTCVSLSVLAPLIVLCFIFISSDDTENHHMLKHSRDLCLDACDRWTDALKWAIFAPGERFRISKQVNKMSVALKQWIWWSLFGGD